MVMAMKRLQIMIEPELDDALERQAAKEKVSKAALIRRYVRKELTRLPPIEEDPIWGLVGMYKGEPVNDIDEVVYGGHERDRP
jgi:hypothetical protein